MQADLQTPEHTMSDAVRILVFSGSLAVFASSLLGVAMLVPMQPWGRRIAGGVKWKQVGAAHLDWIVLGLMQGLAAGFVAAFAIAPPAWAVWALVAGAWLNPLPYVFRAFGLNAFVLGGPPKQVAAASLGALSATAIIAGWACLLWMGFTTF